MAITPDGRTLIIAESFAGQLTAFDIDPDGVLSGRRVFAAGLGPDGGPCSSAPPSGTWPTITSPTSNG
jgi:sugar lactone lactonase YvrE